MNMKRLKLLNSFFKKRIQSNKKLFTLILSINRLDFKYKQIISCLLLIGIFAILLLKLFIIYKNNTTNIFGLNLNHLNNLKNFLSIFVLVQFLLLFLIYVHTTKKYIIFYLRSYLFNNKNLFIFIFFFLYNKKYFYNKKLYIYNQFIF
jgi:hypothetical protein